MEKQLAMTLEEKQQEGREHCKEYVPAFPLTYYYGKCANYIFHGGHCGVAFVNSMCCRCGAVDKF